MRKPNLFLIGHKKCGTTALYNFLIQHPKIFTPELKEPDFFAKEFIYERFKDKRLINKFAPTYEAYLKQYSKAKDQTYLIDATPRYIFSKEAAKRIKEFNPDAKIIAIFREPITFLRSLHSDLIFGFYEEEKDLLKATNLEKQRKKEGKFSFLYYSEWLKYSEQLKRYLACFPRNQIKIVIYEKLKEDNKKMVDEIFDFLEISKDVKINFGIHNPRKEWRFPAIKRFGETPIIWANAKRLLPKPVFKVINGIYLLLIKKKSKRVNLPEKTTKILKKRYLKGVLEFEKLLKEEGFVDKDFDLVKKWGYHNVS